jgi:hypothetical protein
MAQNRPKSAQKGPGKPFTKGQTGNPGGRPKKTPEELDLIAACKAKAPEALDVIMHIMKNGENEKNQLSAAIAIIERGYGKAMQPQEVKLDGKIEHEVSMRPKLSRDEWLASLNR